MAENTVDKFSISENSFTFYIISQIENDNQIVLINSQFPAHNTEMSNIKIITDRETDIDILKRIRSLITEYIKQNILTDLKDIFWLKLIISFIAAFIIFMFTAIIIPDPIPLLDELAISVFGGYFFHITFSKSILLKLLPVKTIDKHLSFLNQVEVITNSTLIQFNEVFEKFYERNITSRPSLEDDIIYLKKIINIFSLKQIIEIKNFLKILAKQYNFKKIKLKHKKLNKKGDKTIFSPVRFKFYYLMYTILFAE